MDMMVVIILIIAGLCGFCIIAADELKEWKDLSLHSWLIALLLLGGVIGCLFIMQDSIRTESIKNYTEGKYRLEEVVYSDTTYVVKRRR
jgi:heme/copper-type cytochrome/quinol oxidase subunit 2